MTKEQKERVSIGLKGYFVDATAWNKGKKYGKYDEPSAKRFRRNKEYYLSELEKNSKRSREVYNKEPHGVEQSAEWKKNVQELTGVGIPKFWSSEEEEFLEDNYHKMKVFDIALKLGRSWVSISRKANRLKLKKYHSWK